MGYKRHHAIVVSAEPNMLRMAREEALNQFSAQGLESLVSPPVQHAVNGDASFFIAPDGSKEGWEESDNGDWCRDAFIEWLQTCAFEDGSSPIAWAEVQFGDERQEAGVLRDSDHPTGTPPLTALAFSAPEMVAEHIASR